jgi:AmmeMemoRadiSam system protein A
LNNVEFTPLIYRNSGDAPVYGDKSRVVGYYSTAVSIKKNDGQPAAEVFSLSEEDKDELLKIARSSITEYISNGNTVSVDNSSFSDNLKREAGAFVTLTKKGTLRGCIGSFDPRLPLYLVVQEMAIAAAVNDTRFPAVEKLEIDDLEIEISVLSPLKRISSEKEIILGRDGIYIRKGQHSGTFLPQVATGNPKWTVEDFLGYCSRDKAGLGWTGWKDAELYTYQALIFHEKE